MNEQIQKFISAYRESEDVDRALAAAAISPVDIPSFGYYVYLLIDPRFSAVFYIGKGRGNRLFQHARERKVSAKSSRIAEMRREGHAVRHVVVSAHGSEREAYAVEAELIEGLRDCGITNIAGVVIDRHDRQFTHAKAMLSQLKSFEHWAASAPPALLCLLAKLFGSPRAFYERYRAELVRYSQEPQVTEVWSGREAA